MKLHRETRHRFTTVPLVNIFPENLGHIQVNITVLAIGDCFDSHVGFSGGTLVFMHT